MVKRTTPGALALAALTCLSPPVAETYTVVPQKNRVCPSRTIGRTFVQPFNRQTMILRPATQKTEETDPARSRSVGWHRKVFKKVFHKSDQNKMLHMKGVLETEEKEKVLSVTDSIIRKAFEEFEENAPSSLFPIESVLRSSEEVDWTLPPGELPVEEVSLPELARKTANENDNSKLLKSPAAEPVESAEPVELEGGSAMTRFTRSWFQNLVTTRLDRWSKGSHENMIVKCEPKGSVGKLLLRGHYCSDISVDVDRIAFPRIRMSSGRLEAKGMTLNLWSFAPGQMGKTRYPNKFDFFARNITFTQEDLFESRCIRNGLRRLLTRILKHQGMKTTTVNINSISILPSGMISCLGEATPLFGPPVPFEVQTGLGIASRGYVLTFPGLKLSLGPNIGFFVPILPEVTVDLGHNAQLLSVDINGQRAEITVSARATITPRHTIKLHKYIQSKDAYAAQYAVDVGRFLTRIGNFTS